MSKRRLYVWRAGKVTEISSAYYCDVLPSLERTTHIHVPRANHDFVYPS